MYVEGEWYESDDEDNKEITSFSIDENFDIIVKTQTSKSSKSEIYKINNEGKLIKK